MKELVKLDNKQIVTSSRKVAEVFDKRHSDVLRAIEDKIKRLEQLENAHSANLRYMFYESEYTIKNGNGRKYKEYLMNRDGFSFIVMGFTGVKADILNAVGVMIVEHPELFTRTLENMEECFEEYDEYEIAEKIATSSLVGADDALAIEEWIDEQEVETMKN